MKRNEFAKTPATGTYGLIILDVLRDGPSYGYGIAQRIFAQSHHTIRRPQGTLYPALHRLERQRLIVGQWHRAPTGRERRYYRLTARGQRLWREQRTQWRSFAGAVNALLGL
jgi:PadR family transcriptional regulator, regulatory protein PadR